MANTVVGLVVAWLPLGAALVGGRTVAITVSVGWGIVVTVFTGYRLLVLGYLPGAEPVAKLLGLHDRIGPDRPSRDTRKPK